jgi:hypothetical protein
MLDQNNDIKSQGSYKSTPSTRSNLLQRAQQLRDKSNLKMVDTPTTASTRGPPTPSSQTTASTRRRQQQHQQQQQQQQPRHQEEESQDMGQHDAPHEAVVSPELLVDALSGHEDGLLAIAERMMEHYDRGYDAMGEAIIDAFADVQKLFQHVVEAAHMEGAAFEASRREDEIQELRALAAQAAQGGLAVMAPDGDVPASPAGPVRHDEFIDQDVKDCLNEAIQKGAALKEAAKHLECFELYERACQSASALLPVDSDHRGRLQLSIARADSMSPDRGCAILRYAMDDVLRSGLRAGKTPVPDHSTRADVVLQKPKAHPHLNGIQSVQSTEEQLNSLVEEMKEILEAPVYKDTPLQEVAKRFWVALQETQKQQSRNEERLEQNLGKLKGEFLLARAVRYRSSSALQGLSSKFVTHSSSFFVGLQEWEEKLSRAVKQTEHFKQKCATLQSNSGPTLMDEARSVSERILRGQTEDEKSAGFQSINSAGQRSASRGAESIASLSSMAQHARTLVGQFNCVGLNERMGPIVDTEVTNEVRDGRPLRYAAGQDPEWRDRRSNDAAKKAFVARNNGGGFPTRVVDV